MCSSDLTIVILRSPMVDITYNHTKNYAWYDIYGIPLKNLSDINFEQLKNSSKILEKAIENEVNLLNGNYENIIVGGHSQGASIALYQAYSGEKKLGGVFAFSGFLPPCNVSDDKNTLNAYLGYGDEDNGIESLSHESGKDRAEPEVLALGPYLELGKDKGVGELTEEVSRKGSDGDSGCRSENYGICILILPEGGIGHGNGKKIDADGKKTEEEAGPDDGPCLTESVDLGKDVSQDIRDREEHNGGGKGDVLRYGPHLSRDEVGQDETCHESDGDHHKQSCFFFCFTHFITPAK